MKTIHWATACIALALNWGCNWADPALPPADSSRLIESTYGILGGTPEEHCACDVTGGGFIFLGGERVNFGFNGRTIAGDSRIHGDVNIVNRNGSIHYQSAEVTSLTCTNVAGEHPRLTGTVTIAGTLKTGEAFSFVVTDSGESGTIDSVAFSVDGTVVFSQTDLAGTTGTPASSTPPGGGNIQLHTEECP